MAHVFSKLITSSTTSSIYQSGSTTIDGSCDRLQMSHGINFDYYVHNRCCLSGKIKIWAIAMARFTGKPKSQSGTESDFFPEGLTPNEKTSVRLSSADSQSAIGIYSLDLPICSSKKIGRGHVGFGWDHYKADASKKAEAVVSLWLGVFCDE